ncbi:MAG: response regulator [Gemmatimonadales bacterium]|nr:response regulator [Gemmatimonadales bacterium]
MVDDPSSAAALPGAKAILIIDDTAVVRRLAFRILAESGYRVFEAATATEALEVLQLARGRVDLVILDVVMPDVSGVDTLRVMQEKSPEIKVVFMSGYPAEILAREGLKDLNVRFLAKPFTREELLKTVAAALGPKKPNGEHREAGRSREP